MVILLQKSRCVNDVWYSNRKKGRRVAFRSIRTEPREWRTRVRFWGFLQYMNFFGTRGFTRNPRRNFMSNCRDRFIGFRKESKKTQLFLSLSLSGGAPLSYWHQTYHLVALCGALFHELFSSMYPIPANKGRMDKYYKVVRRSIRDLSSKHKLAFWYNKSLLII